MPFSTAQSAMSRQRATHNRRTSGSLGGDAASQEAGRTAVMASRHQRPHAEYFGGSGLLMSSSVISHFDLFFWPSLSFSFSFSLSFSFIFGAITTPFFFSLSSSPFITADAAAFSPGPDFDGFSFFTFTFFFFGRGLTFGGSSSASPGARYTRCFSRSRNSCHAPISGNMPMTCCHSLRTQSLLAFASASSILFSKQMNCARKRFGAQSNAVRMGGAAYVSNNCGLPYQSDTSCCPWHLANASDSAKAAAERLAASSVT
mmetsp:Transcript_2889/g.4881  ORF Transcript_2889/g.4881 Transcript_2889/m.4881 type:complete len:259 (+) Transcript_2889:1092-1868(+)